METKSKRSSRSSDGSIDIHPLADSPSTDHQSVATTKSATSRKSQTKGATPRSSSGSSVQTPVGSPSSIDFHTPSSGATVSPAGTLSPVIEGFHTVEEQGHRDYGSQSSDEGSGNYQPKDMIKILIPVAVCMLCVITLTIIITSKEERERRPFMALTPFNTPQAPTSQRIWESLANVGILIGVVVTLTFVVVVLYLCYCYKILLVLLGLPVFMVNFFFTWLYSCKVFVAWNTPVDYITAAIIVLNFGTVGVLAVFGRVPMRLQQAYLVYLCAVMATVYIQYMPNWTVWMFLGALAIWDLIAVLTPCGPLRILVGAVQKRDHDFVPGMIYTTMIWTMADGIEEHHEQHEHKEKRRLRLGLGDFVFYSLLIGKSTETAIATRDAVDWDVVLACYVAILAGLLGTIALLVVFEKALPALPISIALGLVCYFTSAFVASPFAWEMTKRQIFF